MSIFNVPKTEYNEGGFKSPLLGGAYDMNVQQPNIASSVDLRARQLAPNISFGYETNTLGNQMSPLNQSQGSLWNMANTRSTADANAQWEAGEAARANEYLKNQGWSDSEISRLNRTGEASPDRGLSDTQAAMVGAGIEAGAQLAEGVAIGVQKKRAREKAERDAMNNLAEMRLARDKELEEQARVRNFEKEQLEWNDAVQNFELRVDMFENDLAKELQEFQDRENLVNGFLQSAQTNEALKTAIAQRMGRS